MTLLEPAVLEAVGKIMDEFSRFHRADRIYVARALLGNREFMDLFCKAQRIGPYPMGTIEMQRHGTAAIRSRKQEGGV